MGSKVIDEIVKTYLGTYSMITALGYDCRANTEAILSYTSNIDSYDQTPAIRIDRASFDEIYNTQDLASFTFAEKIAIAVTKQVLESSNINLKSERTLLVLSTTKGEIESIETDFERSYLWSFASKIQAAIGIKQTPKIISTACISGVAALIYGSRMIEQGKYDDVLVVGVDVINSFIISGFNSFKSVSPTLCKPYDAQRDGLTPGEGAATIHLTNKKELSTSNIVITGGALSNDANHISGPSRTGEELSFSMQKAMQEAGVSAHEIGYVNLHGTATPYNDEMESKAMHLAGLCHVPTNSLKPYFGHTFGASGLIESIMVLEQMQKEVVFGVKGYTENGVSFPLNVEAQHRTSIEIDHALKTASGFGGTNAAIVFSKDKSFKKPLTDKRNTLSITEVASVSLSYEGEEFGQYIKQAYKELADANLKFFKMDALSKLGYVASCQLLKGITLEAKADRIGIVLANRSASLETDLKHQENVNQQLAEGASPSVFVYTLPNIVAAEIAIKHKFKGEILFFVEEHKNMDALHEYASSLIYHNRCDAVIYGYCDALHKKYHTELKLLTSN